MEVELAIPRTIKQADKSTEHQGVWEEPEPAVQNWLSIAVRTVVISQSAWYSEVWWRITNQTWGTIAWEQSIIERHRKL